MWIIVLRFMIPKLPVLRSAVAGLTSRGPRSAQHLTRAGNVQVLARTFSGCVRLSEVQTSKPVTQRGSYGMYELLLNLRLHSHRRRPVSG